MTAASYKPRARVSPSPASSHLSPVSSGASTPSTISRPPSRRPSAANILASSCSCACSNTKKSNKAKWGLRTLIVAVVVALYSWANTINDSLFLLTPPDLNHTVQSALVLADSTNPNPGSSNMTHLLSHLVPALVTAHPQIRWNTDYTNPSEWVFNNAGGAMGSMFLLHASITEYIIIFGTSIGTEGHTGRHTADDYFHILQGRQTAYTADGWKGHGIEVYEKGDVHHLQRGVVKGYGMDRESWALEYARGWIPLMLPFGFADSIFSTNDLITLYHTVRITGREMIANLLVGKI